MRRALVPLVLLLACSGCDSGAVRVCTWNVANLGWGFTGGKDLGRVARVIDEQCDVANLQEVKNKDGMGKLLDALRALDSWDGTATPTAYRSEHYAVVFRKSVALQDAAGWRCPSGINPSSDQRPACAVLINPEVVQEPFWLIGIHILWSQSEADREQNVADLASQIQNMLSGLPDEPRLLLGDFNVQPADAPGKWATLAKGPPAMKRISDENPTNITGTGASAYYKSSYDHVLMSEADLGSVTGGVVRVNPLDYAAHLGDFKTNVSDHIPLMVTLYE